MIKSFVRPLLLGMIALTIFTCHYLFGGPNEANKAKAAEQEAAAFQARQQAVNITLMRMTWTVIEVDTTHAQTEEDGSPDEYKTSLWLVADSGVAPINWEFWSCCNDFDEYEVLWKELVPGSEVQFDFRDNPGSTNTEGYLIPRIEYDSPRQVQV